MGSAAGRGTKPLRQGSAGLWWLLAAALLSSVVAVALGWWLIAVPAEGRIAPRVFVGRVAVGGLTVEEARRTIEAQLDTVKLKGWVFDDGTRRVTIDPTARATGDPDVAYELATYDVAASVQRAYAAGRQWRWPTISPWSIRIPVTISVDANRVVAAVLQAFPEIEQPARPPRFHWAVAEHRVNLTPPQAGQRLNRPVLMAKLEQALADLERPEITVSITSEPIAVTSERAAALLPTVNSILTRGPLVITAGEKRWEIPGERLSDYLTVALRDGQPAVAVSDDFAAAELGPIEQAVTQPLQQPRFKMEDGRVVVWRPPLDGRSLDARETIRRLEAALADQGPFSIEAAVAIDRAPALEGEGATLGIKEIIGVGRSNFSGSPKNRRHNISVGAAALNGLLIGPGETFSLLKALGNIDADAGYLPELVIKGNKTVPEYGGGLCQIGTTTFRAALSAGLPILERQNHSYRVRYYEPAGTDATIYNPKPDFRFLNDTGRSILIQTKLDGDNLIFEFWGTKDGRVITQTASRIYNIVKPPPKKVIETTSLPPGEEKCTERAHDGADAEFTYTVTSPDGLVTSQVFRSHYRPWQEVCLRGVASPPAPPTGTGAPAGAPSGSTGTDTPGADSPAAVTP